MSTESRRRKAKTRAAARTPGRFRRFERRNTTPFYDIPDAMWEDVIAQAFDRSINTPQWADALYDYLGGE